MAGELLHSLAELSGADIGACEGAGLSQKPIKCALLVCGAVVTLQPRSDVLDVDTSKRLD